MTFTPSELQTKRKALGLSAAELSRRTGIHRSTISRIEHGAFTPYPSQLRRIEVALNSLQDEEPALDVPGGCQ